MDSEVDGDHEGGWLGKLTASLGLPEKHVERRSDFVKFGTNMCNLNRARQGLGVLDTLNIIISGVSRCRRPAQKHRLVLRNFLRSHLTGKRFQRGEVKVCGEASG